MLGIDVKELIKRAINYFQSDSDDVDSSDQAERFDRGAPSSRKLITQQKMA